MRKEEVYNLVVDFQLKSGQGLSGITTVVGNAQSQSIKRHLETLIEEGLVVKSSSGTSSIGHPSASDWYMPSKGYNVWEDKLGLRALGFVRIYLGILNNSDDVEFTKFAQDSELMKEYAEWLQENDQSLKEMLALKPMQVPPVSTEFVLNKLKKEEIEYLVSRNWYKNNKSVADALSQLEADLKDYQKLLRLVNEIDSLINRQVHSAETKIQQEENNNRRHESEIKLLFTKKLIDAMEDIDKKLLVQHVFSKATAGYE